jgi:hypothetical protein
VPARGGKHCLNGKVATRRTVNDINGLRGRSSRGISSLAHGAALPMHFMLSVPFHRRNIGTRGTKLNIRIPLIVMSGRNFLLCRSFSTHFSSW